MGRPIDVSTTIWDRGWLIRVSPYNSIDFPGLLSSVDEVLDPVFGGITIEGAYDEATQNYGRSTIEYFVGERSELAMFSHKGKSVHVATGFPGVLRTRLERENLGWIANSLSPLLSWGKAWDRTVESGLVPDTGEHAEGTEEEYSGWEIVVANLVSIRRGRVIVPDGEIRGTTSGWGLGVKVGDLGGFRYDEATVPQALDLSQVKRTGFTMYVNPVAVWRGTRRSAT